MNRRYVSGPVLLLVQLALVLSVATKYLYERETRPRIWVRTAQLDPNLPLRGRYLALRLMVDACGLPHDREHFIQGYQVSPGTRGPGSYNWRISLDVQNGHLSPRLEDRFVSRDGVEYLTQTENQGCDRVPLSDQLEFFIPDTAKPPFPLKQEEDLWVEVTVPKTGPPRPIELALSDSAGFRPLRFE